MSVSHVGGRPVLPVVPQQQSAPKSQAPADGAATELDRNLLPETRKTLPAQAKGAAHGLSVQKFFDKWDQDGDGKITTAEAGPRFGRGVLAELLKLQETAGAGGTDSSGAPGTPDPQTPPAADDGSSVPDGTGPTGATGGADAGAGDSSGTGDTAPTGSAGSGATTDVASNDVPPPAGDATPQVDLFAGQTA